MCVCVCVTELGKLVEVPCWLAEALEQLQLIHGHSVMWFRQGPPTKCPTPGHTCSHHRRASLQLLVLLLCIDPMVCCSLDSSLTDGNAILQGLRMGPRARMAWNRGVRAWQLGSTGYYGHWKSLQWRVTIGKPLEVEKQRDGAMARCERPHVNFVSGQGARAFFWRKRLGQICQL